LKTIEKEIIRDSFGWDVRNWSRAIPFWEKHIGDIKGKKALELGNGGKFGGLSLWLAYKGAEVICSDYKGVSEEAKAIHAKYEVGKNIKYDLIDAKNIPYENTFDIIVSKSILGGIILDNNADTGKLVNNGIHRSLVNNGFYVSCDNASATKLHNLFRRKHGAGRVKWKYFKNSELLDLLSCFRLTYLKNSGFLGCFGRTEFQRIFLSFVDSFLHPFLPHFFKYIIFSVSQKRTFNQIET
jgi:hypothetical protein